jgi:hypothetical protein
MNSMEYSYKVRFRPRLCENSKAVLRASYNRQREVPSLLKFNENRKRLASALDEFTPEIVFTRPGPKADI